MIFNNVLYHDNLHICHFLYDHKHGISRLSS